MNPSAMRAPFEVAVPRPGHGELVVLAHRASETTEETLRGPDIGSTLHALTQLALSDEAGDATIRCLGHIHRDEARSFLPAFQRATVLAGSGAARYERLMAVHPSEAPLEPLCAHCGQEGSSAGAPTLEVCAALGHAPFGAHSALSWAATLERAEADYRWWEAMRGLRELRHR